MNKNITSYDQGNQIEYPSNESKMNFSPTIYARIKIEFYSIYIFIIYVLQYFYIFMYCVIQRTLEESRRIQI